MFTPHASLNNISTFCDWLQAMFVPVSGPGLFLLTICLDMKTLILENRFITAPLFDPVTQTKAPGLADGSKTSFPLTPGSYFKAILSPSVTGSVEFPKTDKKFGLANTNLYQIGLKSHIRANQAELPSLIQSLGLWFPPIHVVWLPQLTAELQWMLIESPKSLLAYK